MRCDTLQASAISDKDTVSILRIKDGVQFRI
jgi:hypothetical protein